MNRDFPPGEWSIPLELARELDFQLGKLRVHPSLCEVVNGGSLQSVEPRVMQALVALAQRKGIVVSRDELVQRCWSGMTVGDDAINRCIAKVRKLADLDGGRSFRVDTVTRVGYRLVELADEASSAPPPTDHSAAGSEATVFNAIRRTSWWSIPGAAVLLATIAAYVLLPRQARLSFHEAVSQATVVRPHLTTSLPGGAVFSDCSDGCPEMVVVPAGYFNMGSARSDAAESSDARPALQDNETPQHEVLIAERFAVARYDVTREEFARFAVATNRADDGSCQTLTPAGLFVETVGANWRHPGFAQTELDPVVCMSWGDASAYVSWLARKTGKPYRLLSEAEWEYAARAGSTEPRAPTTSTLGPCGAQNGADADYHARYPGDKFVDAACHDGFPATSPVGHFPANAFGLFDMQGNVWQWTADCYDASYDGAPVDGSPWVDPDCAKRVARGGAWITDTGDIRFALRGASDPNLRYSSNGIRVARSL
jgi:formylglycine-generating enzyme required for sulfatase activity/DNA-binding winged helix-turn-helix (wHTH) protein